VTHVEDPLAAIDVGTNAVRFKLARPRADGALETLHEERDPVRPGEGVFKTGSIPDEVADRLLATLRRYGAVCRRHRARVRAVATSAVREARNGNDIVRRARREAGLDLEVISGREEARLICLGVLEGTPSGTRSLVVDVGGGSTEVAVADGVVPAELYSLALGAVRLTELFRTAGEVTARKLELMREYASEVAERGIPQRIRPALRRGIGSSGTIRAVVSFAASPGTAHATLAQLAHAVDDLADMGAAQRRTRFDPKRAEIIVAGAVVLEAVARRLGLASIAATERGLRDGVLIDLSRRIRPNGRGQPLAEAVIGVGRWFRFDEPHARQVARAALMLFDTLARAHRLPAAARAHLEAAALLHDVGHALGYQRHHKHTQYIIENVDIPGLSDRERGIVARIARFHRRSPPDTAHAGMQGLSLSTAQVVRKLSTILRVADALDRSHHQPARKLSARLTPGACLVRIGAAGPVDLELWDAAHETALFRRVFGRRLVIQVERAR
jgi:exopolyphosphatase/guanosine-5'-triphosphate,3'-diphosphate pyrophosphatase